jgi:hypothetical protein
MKVFTSSGNAYKTNVDLINNNIYFINSNNCLEFSERLNQFESFYSVYNNKP